MAKPQRIMRDQANYRKCGGFDFLTWIQTLDPGDPHARPICIEPTPIASVVTGNALKGRPAVRQGVRCKCCTD